MNEVQNTTELNWMHNLWHQQGDILHFIICIQCSIPAVHDPVRSDLRRTNSDHCTFMYFSSILACQNFSASTYSEPHWHIGNLVTLCGNTSRVTLVCEIKTWGNLLHNATVNHDTELWSSRWFCRSKNKFIWTPAAEVNCSEQTPAAVEKDLR